MTSDEFRRALLHAGPVAQVQDVEGEQERMDAERSEKHPHVVGANMGNFEYRLVPVPG